MAKRILMRVGAALGAVAGLFVLAHCASRNAVAPPQALPERPAWSEQVDWTTAQAEATRLLSGYLQVDTQNPPGHETLGAAYLAGVLEAEGIPVELDYEFAPGRSNLVARLKAEQPTEPPLCLLHHIDVVTAEADHWEQPPFSGVVDDDGYLWGRGALDMKGVGVLQLSAMIWLKRLGVPLKRDVVLVAVGDEEVDNLGVIDLDRDHWDSIGCSHVLNEGGFGVQDALFDDLTTFTVSFTEKGALWLRMVAHGPPGHGSTPMPESAPSRLQAALRALAARDPEPSWHPEVYTLLGTIGRRVGGITGAVLQSPYWVRALAAGKLMEHPVSRALLIDTVNVTGFGGAEKPNVVPGEVWAQIDARLLPGSTQEQVLDELRALVSDVEGIDFEVISYLPAIESSTDDPVYRAIIARLQAEWPEAAVGPLIMPGTTDCQVLRARGVQCYGVAPFLFTEDELRGMHGDNERVQVDNLGRAVRVMTELVLDVAAKGEVIRTTL